MAELELIRTPGDRRLFALNGVGTLRVGGMFSRAATAGSGSSSWQLQRHGIEGKSWGKRPVKITLDDVAMIDPGLLLFAAFVVRTLAEDAAATAS